jgi:hypothetical protein
MGRVCLSERRWLTASGRQMKLRLLLLLLRVKMV